MTRAKFIIGIIFGGSLAVLAAWIGLRSFGEVMAPQAGFALVDQAETSSTATVSSSKYFAGAIAALPPKPKKVPAKPPAIPVTEPAPVVVAPEPQPVIEQPPVVQPPPVGQPEPAPIPEPVVVAPPPTPVPDASVSSHLFISEVMAGSETSGDDEFIELYNAGTQSVDLTGWSVNKKTASGKEDDLVAKARLQGKSVGPGQYFLIAHDGNHFEGGAPDALWAKSNSLAAKNNAVVLYNTAGAKVDEAGWMEIPKGGSFARVPVLEGGQFSVQNTPTPKQ